LYFASMSGGGRGPWNAEKVACLTETVGV